MFDESGKKIQSLALVIFVFLAVMSICFGGYMVFTCLTEDLGRMSALFLMSGICTIVFGILFAWVFSIVLFGFGELVDDTEEIRSITEDIYNEMHGNKKEDSKKE